MASLVPVVGTDWEQLVATGAVMPATSRLHDVEPVPSDGAPTLTELLTADRDDDR
ncbi:hypothetical protein ABIB25_004855 [Nakamurella sp. UYEF19]|uniref:hypothetical protein n=1 Tax=Nakamurella sp. UYEF19 TaxID=1756392 RepID=UPI00339AB92F